MQNAGLIMSGLAVSSGVGALMLLLSNLIVWAVVTAWIGSMFAFVGFSLIVIALTVRTASEDPELEVEMVRAS
ncbi:MAG: hypothetical protein AAF501_19425 [Pseudomonadota bacterium]